MFKAADEPQTKALANERSRTESSRQTPEDMHAITSKMETPNARGAPSLEKTSVGNTLPSYAAYVRREEKLAPA